MEDEKDDKLNIEDIKFIMVTHRDDHWDKLAVDENGRVKAHFSKSVIHDGIFLGSFLQKAPTLFIKRTADKSQIENCWIGTVTITGYSTNSGVMFFNVENLEQIPCPDEYVAYSIGWHLNKETILTSKQLQDNFFKQLMIADWKEFEDGCYDLLRYMGIECIYSVPRDNSGGKEDGAFLIRDLAVLYDCTLDPNFLDKKKRQVKNYIQELKTGEIEIGPSVYPLNKKHHKQVWIITRNEQATKLEPGLFIRDGGDVIVKEVPIQKLTAIFKKKLAENLKEEGLYKLLLKI